MKKVTATISPAVAQALAYQQLRRAAAVLVCVEQPGTRLEPEELVHELYIRLSRTPSTNYVDQQHFFAVAVRTMRRILIDHARAHRAAKRVGQRTAVPIEEICLCTFDHTEQRAVLSQILDQLDKQSPRQGMIVRARLFEAATMDEIAADLGVSSRTVKREWAAACAWLLVAWTGGKADMRNAA